LSRLEEAANGRFSDIKQNKTQSQYEPNVYTSFADRSTANTVLPSICYNIYSGFHFYIHVIDIVSRPFFQKKKKRERVMAVSINNIHQLLLMA
jgi:hypothetical protein